MTAILSNEPLTDREKHELIAGFFEPAVAKTGSHGNIIPFSFSLRDNGHLVGAITGQTFWGSLQIHNHWVEQESRHHGHGLHLLNEAEGFAHENGCDFMLVETFDKESRDFYLHQGFELEMERPGYSGGLLHLFLMKKII